MLSPAESTLPSETMVYSLLDDDNGEVILADIFCYLFERYEADYALYIINSIDKLAKTIPKTDKPMLCSIEIANDDATIYFSDIV